MFPIYGIGIYVFLTEADEDVELAWAQVFHMYRDTCVPYTYNSTFSDVELGFKSTPGHIYTNFMFP